MEFHAHDAVRVSGLSYKQIDYTLRSGWMRSRGGGQSGLPRIFNVYDLVAFSVLRAVLRSGVPARKVAAALRLVQRGGAHLRVDRLKDALLWTDGRAAALIRKGHSVPVKGRAVQYLLDIGAAAARVQARLERRKTMAA
jgi:hypothetical protein